jgi:hypothetical protein
LVGEQISTQIILNDSKTDSLKFPLQTDYNLIATDGTVLLQTALKNIPFLMQNKSENIALINTHTFSQADFDAVGEVLLCPRQLGLLEVPNYWANQIRLAFHVEESVILDAPARVTFQQLADGSFVLHNYNQSKTWVEIQLPKKAKWIDRFTGNTLKTEGKLVKLEMTPRSRIWCESIN